MGTKREVLGRVVVVKPWRKSGNGGKGGGRQNNSGKRGVIYQVNPDGSRTELARDEGATFSDLTRKLFAKRLDNKRLIPDGVALNKSGETFF